MCVCRAAVYFEMGEFERCAADCDTAVEKGREARADYKIIARALTRKGNALVRQDRLEEAIEVYQKSLTEHRCALPGSELQQGCPADHMHGGRLCYSPAQFLFHAAGPTVNCNKGVGPIICMMEGCATAQHSFYLMQQGLQAWLNLVLAQTHRGGNACCQGLYEF